jgi:hypothetical protein
MINVFFVPGMFGSTIEYVLSNYTQEHTPVDATICSDGSMHSYHKQLHITNLDSVIDLVSNNPACKITTLIYPFKNQHLSEILTNFRFTESDKNILMHADSLRSAEINMLLQYHKIAFGTNLQHGLTIFSGNNAHNIVNWNSDYTAYDQMKPWEWREWFSLFYVTWTQEWQQSCDQVPEYFLKIKNTDVLLDTESTLTKLIDFCKLTVKPGLAEFVQEWQSKQKYIVDEFYLLDQIIDSTITQQALTWQPVNIVAEAIVQQRLRAKGYEIRCDGLNTFPTDSQTLYNLLEKV